MTAVARGKRPPENSISAMDMNDRWRLRVQLLEEQLQDARADYSALQTQYGELSADYKHVLGQLWRANAGMVRRDR